MQLGKANYEKGTGKKRFKIVDGNNIYRVLPPMGSLAEKGQWSKYHSVVWGYRTSEGKNYPFGDCRKTNYRTKMVEVESAAYLRSEKIKAIYKEMKAKDKAGEKVDPDQLKRAEEMADRFNMEGKHYINVVNLNGEIGLLKVGAKAKQLLEEEIKRLMGKGVDPLSIDNGRFFNIFRSGTGMNTTYQVTEYKEEKEVNGEVASFSKVHKMDAAFISRLDKEAFDLGTLYVYPTPEQIEAIVKGAPVDEVLNINTAQASEEASDQEDTSAEEARRAALEAEEKAKAAATKAKAEAEAKAKQEATAKAEAEKSLQTSQESASGGTSTMVSMSDEDFLRQFGG